MKLKLSYLLAAAVLSTATLVQAQDKKPQPPSREEFREKFKNMTPEERAEKMKEWREKQGEHRPDGDRRREEFQHDAKKLGINPEDMRNLSPEERRAKMVEALNAKLAELNKKKADKTITEEESKLLERLQERKKFMEEHKDGPPRREGGDRPGPKDGPPVGEKGPKRK